MTTPANRIAGVRKMFGTAVAVRIEIDGVDVDVSCMPPHLRDVTTVFQGYALLSHMSLRDTSATACARNGCGRST